MHSALDTAAAQIISDTNSRRRGRGNGLARSVRVRGRIIHALRGDVTFSNVKASLCYGCRADEVPLSIYYFAQRSAVFG